MAKRQTRRKFLTAIGTMSAATIAGCSSGASLPDGTEKSTKQSTTAEPSETAAGPTETETPEPDDGSGEVLEDFEDLGEWAAMMEKGRISAETEDAYSGTQSARIEASGDVEYAGVYRSFVGGTDLREKNLSLAIKIGEPQLLDVTVQLLAPDVGNVVSFRRSLTGPTDHWIRVDLGVNNVDREPDLGNVQEIRVIGRKRNQNGQPIKFQIDDLRVVERPESGAVMFTFDASLESHHTSAFPVMQEYDFAGVEAIIPEAIHNTGRLTVGQMREMRDAGWDMAARPRTGSKFLHEFSKQEQREMIERTKSYLESKGFPDGAKHFFTPKNVLGPNSLDIVSEFHEQAFRYGGAPNGLPITDSYNLGHFSGSSGADTRLFVDYAARHKQLAVLQFGEIGEDGMSEDAFRDLLDHVQSSDVTVLTATDLLER